MTQTLLKVVLVIPVGPAPLIEIEPLDYVRCQPTFGVDDHEAGAHVVEQVLSVDQLGLADVLEQMVDRPQDDHVEIDVDEMPDGRKALVEEAYLVPPPRQGLRQRNHRNPEIEL